jgi:hypothetical protein
LEWDYNGNTFWWASYIKREDKKNNEWNDRVGGELQICVTKIAMGLQYDTSWWGI